MRADSIHPSPHRSWRARGPRLAPLVAAIALSSCDGSGPPDRVSQATAAIDNGAPAPTALWYLSGVVRYAGNAGGCTGTLISPRLVLTAAHCLQFDRGKTLANPAQGSGMFGIENVDGRIVGVDRGQVSFTDRGGKLLETATIRHAWLASAPDGGAQGAGQNTPDALSAHDVAILALDRRATLRTAARAWPVRPWLEAAPSVDFWKNRHVEYAGWGHTDHLSAIGNCTALDDSNQHLNPTALSYVGNKALDSDYPVDSRLGSGHAPTPFLIAKYSMTGDSSGKGEHGDSGGPLFAYLPGGDIRIAGVYHGSGCEPDAFGGAFVSAWSPTMDPSNQTRIRSILVRPDGLSRGDDSLAAEADPDGDQVPESRGAQLPFVPESDNCPDRYNPDQRDSTGDGVGDACRVCVWGPGHRCDWPGIVSLSQSTGSIGDRVTVHTVGFIPGQKATRISFGPYAVSSLSCSATGTMYPGTSYPMTDCSVVVPPGSGTVDVRITVGAATSVITPADRFTYRIPMVASVSPSSGPWTGGTDVNILGSGLDKDMQVYFRGVPALWVSCLSSGDCYVGSPNVGAPGPVAITVSVLGSAGATSPAAVFTATAQPALVALKIQDDADIGGSSPGGAPRVIGGKSTIGNPRLNGYALPGGTVISLSSSNPAIASVPATVTIGPGSAVGDFVVTTAAVSANQSVTITATYQGGSVSQVLGVVAPGSFCQPRPCPKGKLWDPQLCRCNAPI